MAELALVLERRVALKIGAGQIVEQDVEARVEQRRPTRAQEREELLLVRRQLVQAPIQRGAGNHPVTSQQIAQCTVFVPLPMKTPVAARVDKAVADLNFQNIQPSGPFAARRQARSPEPVQLQTLPQRQRQPACPPLARGVQGQLREPHLHHLALQLRRLPVLGKQRDLLRP